MMYAWYRQQLLLLVAAGFGLLLVFQTTDLDLWLAGQFYSTELGKFPLHHHWLLDSILHHGMKATSYVLVAGAMYFCFLGYQGELRGLPRRNALLAAIGMVLIPVSITLLKEVTNRHCPWDMVEFGGFVPYQHLLEPAIAGFKAGKCFPAGHASAGFLWVVWGFALRPAGKKIARAALLVGLCLGAAMGGARMLQGAHFLSHTLWTLWFSWAISVALAFLLRAEMGFGVSPGSVFSRPENTEPDGYGCKQA